MTDLDLDATLAAGEQMCQIFTVGPRGTSWRIDDVSVRAVQAALPALVAEVRRLRRIVGETGPRCARCGHQEGKHYYGDRGPDGCRECNGDHTFTTTDGVAS